MKPSSKQLIDSVAWSLQEKVVPVVDDKWAASTLRSVHCLLTHLSTRVELEGSMLFDDNRDLRGVLQAVMAQLDGAREPLADVRIRVAAVLVRHWRDEDAYPTVASLGEENEALRGAVDDLLKVLHRDDAGVDRSTANATVEALDGYTRRRLERDQPMFMPAFLSSNF